MTNRIITIVTGKLSLRFDICDGLPVFASFSAPLLNIANRFRYRRRKVRNHNGFGLFLYEFLQLIFIDILSPKRLSGRTLTKKYCKQNVIFI